MANINKDGKFEAKVVIMMGPPGAGKGTHATKLSKDLKFPHISTGDLFRENIKKNTELGKKAKSLIEEGVLVPDDVVNEMLLDYMRKNCDHLGYILDGYPRNLNQAKVFNSCLSEQSKVIVIDLIIQDSKLVDRITGRLMCRACGTPFHKTFLPPNKENICDSCNGELYQRTDDTKDVVKKRLEVYHKETEPVLDFYKDKSIFIKIDAEQEKDKVFKDILVNITENL